MQWKAVSQTFMGHIYGLLEDALIQTANLSFTGTRQQEVRTTWTTPTGIKTNLIIIVTATATRRTVSISGLTEVSRGTTNVVPENSALFVRCISSVICQSTCVAFVNDDMRLLMQSQLTVLHCQRNNNEICLAFEFMSFLAKRDYITFG